MVSDEDRKRFTRIISDICLWGAKCDCLDRMIHRYMKVRRILGPSPTYAEVLVEIGRELKEEGINIKKKTAELPEDWKNQDSFKTAIKSMDQTLALLDELTNPIANERN